ncbi:MAG: hydantoinase/oxoprolinase family protein [Methylovulum sp.]|nr:hydantoinase/oxoprolinase family protein [Methylovulum sp.]
MASLGWDIGGAHVKAAVVNQAGEITGIYQQPCPLWKGLEHLRQAVNAIMQALPQGQYRHAITMTGELVDLFAGREDGVRQIINTMGQLLSNDGLLIFAGQYGLLGISQIDAKHYQAIASLNWLASAQFAAQKTGNGLFVDIGSTTTDILLCSEGKVLAKGYTDYQRLISRELVYTGIVRTAVMAVAQTALDGDQDIGIMAEYFATMADVYRLTGELDEAHDQTETADGAGKTLHASARRLARMIGCDFYPDAVPRWQQFAENIRFQQLQKIKTACGHVATPENFPKNSPLIGAGVGRFLIKELAQQLDHPYLDFSDLCVCSVTPTGMSPADCAPAVSVAHFLLDVPSIFHRHLHKS